MNTVLIQIEACMNNRPLVDIPDDDSIEVPLSALPDPAFSYQAQFV